MSSQVMKKSNIFPNLHNKKVKDHQKLWKENDKFYQSLHPAILPLLKQLTLQLISCLNQKEKAKKIFVPQHKDNYLQKKKP